MSKQVFVIHTEYHLLQTIGIINKYYSGGNNSPYIFQISPLNGKRLRCIDMSSLTVPYNVLRYDCKNPRKDLKNFLSSIIELYPSELFLFDDGHSWVNYLIRRVKENGGKIIFLSDGANFYYYKKRSLKTITKTSLSYFLQNIIAGIFPAMYVFPSYMGGSSLIDEIWLEHPEYCSEKVKAHIKRLSYPKDANYLSILKNVFCFDACESALFDEKLIVFFDSSYKEPEFINRNIIILKRLKSMFQNRKIAIKLHQQSNEEVRAKYEEIGDVVFLQTKIPAEIYISCCKDAYLFAMVSSALFHYNPNCKYYWLYPMYNDLVSYDKLACPVEYISIIKDLKEIQW